MPRRGENIRKRADGRWEARYIRGYQTDGKARYGYLYAKTYAEVRQKKTEAVAACRIENCMPDKKAVLLSSALERWLDSRRGYVKQSTLCQYSQTIYKHLIPALGSYPLNKLTDTHIEQYAQEKRLNGRLDGRGGLSAKSVADQVNLLRWVLRYAMAQGWMPMRVISTFAPKVTRYNPETFNDIDWLRLTHYIKDNLDNCSLGVLISMHTGLRIGEVCGLRFSDIDFTSGILCVNRTLLRVKDLEYRSNAKTKVAVETPKTECSRRKIPVPDFLLGLIKKQYQSASSREAYLITGTQRHMEPRTYYRKYQAIVENCGLEKHTFHALRHSFATRCIERGCDPKTLSEILGHASVKVTLERYMHPSMRAKRAIVERLAQMDLWSNSEAVTR